MRGEAAVGFAEEGDQRIPVLSAKFSISATVGVIKSDSIHDEFTLLPSTGDKTASSRPAQPPTKNFRWGDVDLIFL